MKYDQKKEVILQSCPTCDRSWDEYGEQHKCINKYGRCVVCLARDHPIHGLEFSDVLAFLRDSRDGTEFRLSTDCVVGDDEDCDGVINHNGDANKMVCKCECHKNTTIAKAEQYRVQQEKEYLENQEKMNQQRGSGASKKAI